MTEPQTPDFRSAGRPPSDDDGRAPAERPSLRPLNAGERVLLLSLGGLLPLGTILLELATGLCAGLALDPIPTPLHLVLLLTVPLGNALVFSLPLPVQVRRRAGLGLLNALGLWTSLAYCVVFFPLVLVGLLGPAQPLAFLVFVPYVSFVACLLARIRLTNTGATPGDGDVPGCLPGLAVVGLVILATQLAGAGLRL